MEGASGRERERQRERRRIKEGMNIETRYIYC